MSGATVAPGVAAGAVPAPPSKSYTHRALVAGFLSGRRFEVRRPCPSDDTSATREGLRRLGAEIQSTPRRWRIDASATRGAGRRNARIDCRSSGTTLRFLTALASRGGSWVRFTGAPDLSRRPNAELLEVLVANGAELRGPPANRSLPFEIRGPIRPGRYPVPSSTSSQYASALVLVLSSLERGSTLELRGEIVSRPYLEATRALLTHLGGESRWRGRRIEVEAPVRYRRSAFEVPGDASSAAYLWAAGAVTGGRVAVRGIDERWPQADLALLDILAGAGAQVSRDPGTIAVEGPLRRGIAADLTDSPDLYPLLGAVAALAPAGARSRLTGGRHASAKESDRPTAAAGLARALGARVARANRVLTIRAGRPPRRLRFLRSADHRVVMSAAVAALALERPSRIADARAVGKSFPGFWGALGALGVGPGASP